jgi:dsDNA-specific endonuclease/ATPase MutS2
MFEIGDFVEGKDDLLKGKITAIGKEFVTVETTDGFMLNVKSKDLIKIGDFSDLLKKNPVAAPVKDWGKKKVPLIKPTKTKRNEFIVEIDLHIEKLTSHSNALQPFDILDLQLETAKKQLEFAIRKKFPALIFIHGVGDGVLKAELYTLLNRYEGISFSEANFSRYGAGATHISISQKAQL